MLAVSGLWPALPGSEGCRGWGRVPLRLDKTLLEEFYAVGFRKKRYEHIEELQIDLDSVMDYYNYRRMHLGYKLKQNGFRS